MKPVDEMSISEMSHLLLKHYDYTEDDIHSMSDEDIIFDATEKYEEFENSEIKAQIEQGSLIDLDDEYLSLLDILDEWSDINDDSDLYPNGKDDDDY